MCGINGIITYTNNTKLPFAIKQMNDALLHRGPDNEGSLINKNIALGHRRLSIIDLSDAATQPITDNSGRYVLVYNGELYNFKELKSELSNYDFKTHTDSEVILAAYQKWGTDCLSRFDGMFAFALLDKKDNTLFVARDRIGIKPLYYYQSDNHFLFSSEIKALLASDLVPRKINKAGIYDYVRYQTIHAPDTIIENVSMLMPGHYIIIKNKELKIKKYWSLDFKPEQQEKTCDDIKSDINNLVFESVEKRLMSDVPLGAFLSGGIDSSIITAVMSKLSSSKINTFSVNFGEAEFSEGKYARMVADKFGTNHTEILLTPKDFLDNLPTALKYMDHPSGDGPNSFIVSKVTKEAGITVALSGLGGDEVFAGYDVFKQVSQAYQHKLLSKTPHFVRKLGASTLSTLKKDIRSKKLAELLKIKDFTLENIYPLSRLLYAEKEILSLFASPENIPNKVNKITSEINVKPTHLLSAVSSAEMQTYMQNILLRDTDQMSMASSLEVRVPFLDHKLIEYTYQIPDKFKYPHTPKQLLIEAMNILPDEVVNRPKMGFLLPWDLWLKNELYDFADSRIKSLAARPFFNEQTILSRWQAFQSGDKSVSWARLWIFIVLEDYIQKLNLEF